MLLLLAYNMNVKCFLVFKCTSMSDTKAMCWHF